MSELEVVFSTLHVFARCALLLSFRAPDDVEKVTGRILCFNTHAQAEDRIFSFYHTKWRCPVVACAYHIIAKRRRGVLDKDFLPVAATKFKDTVVASPDALGGASSELAATLEKKRESR